MLKNNLPPVHPGEHIKQGLEHLDLSNAKAAEILGCSRAFMGDLVNGKRDLSVEMCFKISELLGSAPEFWVRLQNQYDIKVAEKSRIIVSSRKAVATRFLSFRKKQKREEAVAL